MKIIIDISDRKYKWIVDNPQTYTDYLDEAIRNGTPLPQGHGRLIDADDIFLIDEQFYTPSDYCVAEGAVNDAPTIIEADTESEGKE